ncbi:MAG: alpha-L-rhamnosidase [Solirubrobacteraceae bacterium]
MRLSAPTHLRVEHLDEALGIMVPRPRLSWRLPDGAREQLAYQLRAGTWDSGRVSSSASVLVPYGGPPLPSGARVDWMVKTWTDLGASAWSAPGWWEMGLLEPADWVARWIDPPEVDGPSHGPHPAYLLRHELTVATPVARARIYATAHGIYELFINGQRVGDMELTPGFTSYRSNLQVQTFDVTGLLGEGRNVVGAILSDGWFRGQLGGARLSGLYGDRVAFLAQLHAYGPDGALTRVGTGPHWTATTGSILAADLMEGQIVDLRRGDRGWCTPGAAIKGWEPVAVRDDDLGRLCSSPAPPVRRVERLRPIDVRRRSPDRQIVDLGQNINGWVHLRRLGPPGTTVTLTHGEALDADGDVTLANLVEADVGPAVEDLPWGTSNRNRPFQVDQVTSAGGDEPFEPRHTTHGFRYVRVEGHPDALGPDDVTGVVVHTDLRRTGWFQCSDDRINRLHEAAVWSFRTNACDIPTDNPTRERAGWTGDWQIFVPAAAFLYDVAGFATKWLRDLAAEQHSDGVVLHCAPDPHPERFTRSAANPWPPGSAGWGDAAVIVPWEIYRAYGDDRVLDEQWPSMKAWVDRAARLARERRHPDRIAARPTPALHEAFIWDTGFHWGEWLEPGVSDIDPAALAVADNGDLATAYLHHSSKLLAESAGVLGRAEDAARYGELADATRAAWQAEFIQPDGGLSRDTQANHVRALAFDVVPDDLRPQLSQRLVELVREAGTHVATGFLATPYVLPVLADNGHLDVAYDLLLQDSEPSWLTMVERDANTIWEHWSGLDERRLPSAPRGVGSLNHYSKGAVITFLHRHVAGIGIGEAPAYRSFEICPMPGGGITSARAVHDSPYGRVESAWRRDGDRFTLDVTVPPGTTAEVRLPDGQRLHAPSGSVTYRCSVRATSAHHPAMTAAMDRGETQ